MSAITTTVDLWKHLCVNAGLELRLKGGKPGRDADIEEALKKSLGVPATATSLAAWLAHDVASPTPRVSIEQLLIAVLKSQSGFALMMQDILNVLIEAGARQSTHILSVEFKFDKVSDPIKATLEQFRESAQRFQRVTELCPKLPDHNVMWSLSKIIRDFSVEPPTSRPDNFPSVSAIASSGNIDVDSLLELVSRLVSDFKALWLKHGETRREVGHFVNSMNFAGMENDVLRGQLNAATDYWDAGVLAGAQEISRQVLSGKLMAKDALEILNGALKDIEWGSAWVDLAVQELLDILALPTWRRRHELYSVWVGTRLLNVVSNAVPDMHFHPVNGVLSFEFGGSRLASFNWDSKQFDIWAELRSSLVGRSSKRKKGIQPDFRVLQTALSKSTNAQTVYVLECKHYLQASRANFVQATSDYARSCPDARVHLVNHGPVNVSNLTAALPVEQQARVEFIGSITPQYEAETGSLSKEIRDVLFPSLPPEVPNPSSDGSSKKQSDESTLATGLVGHVRLEWDDSLKDMDLALRIVDLHGEVAQFIDFSSRGSLDTLPFAQLDQDVREGPGMECINISAWHFAHYELIATNYSQTGDMTPEALRCLIITNQGMVLIRYPKMLSTTAHKWKIADLYVDGGVVTVVECS